MPPRFSSILSSKPFEIKSSDRSYFIHGNIFAERWESFRSAAIDEGGIIDLSDWDSDTVGLFAEFLYTGDYQTSQRTPEGSEAEEGQERNGMNLLETAQSLATRKGWRFGGVDVNLLLVHAKLYALAQDRDVQPLREIAFGRLRETLERIDTATLDGTSRVAVNVIELLMYVYTYTDSPLVNPETPMRDLVSKFAVENIEKLMDRKREMTLLLSEGGDFMVGLMEGVVARLCHAEMYCDEQRYRDIEKEVQDWQGKAAILDGKVRQVAVINAKMRQSEVTNLANARQTDTINTTKIRQLKATYEDRTRELEATYNERIRRLNVANSAEIRQLGTTWEERVRRLNVANSAEIQELNAANTEKVRGILTEGTISCLITAISVFAITFVTLQSKYSRAY